MTLLRSWSRHGEIEIHYHLLGGDGNVNIGIKNDPGTFIHSSEYDGRRQRENGCGTNAMLPAVERGESDVSKESPRLLWL